MKKRMFAGLLAAVLCLSLMPMAAFAATPMQNVNLSAEGVLSWSAVSGAADYQVMVGSGGGTVYGTSQDLNSYCAKFSFVTGDYTVKLYARDAKGNAITEIWQGTYHYVSNQPTLDTAKNLRFEGTTCKWDAVPHANYYYVTLLNENGYRLGTSQYTTKTEYIFSLTAGETYKFSVLASGAGYLDSTAISDAFTFGSAVPMQNVNISAEGVLSWNAVSGAADYQLLIGSAGGTVYGTSQDLNSYCAKFGFDTGDYTVRLYARDADGNALSEMWISTFHYVSTQQMLEKAANLHFEGNTCKWDAVPNAHYYMVTLLDKNGLQLGNGQYTQKTEQPFSLTAGRVYKFSVNASAPGYTDSFSVSEPYTFVNRVMTFDANGGSGSMAAVTGSGNTVTLPPCTFTPPAGKQFNCWQVDGAVGSLKVFYPGQQVEIASDVTAKAVWRNVSASAYTLTFTAGDHGVGSMPPITVQNGGSFTLPECLFTPELGYEFVYWNTGYGAYKHPGETISVSADKAITPVWKKSTYTVTVVTNGKGIAGTTTATGAMGKEVTLYATPQKGYHFKEWKVLFGGVTVTNNKFTLGTSNVEIMAVFQSDAAVDVVYGDVNADGKVNAADALLTLKAAVGKATLDEVQTIAADVNGDEKVNASDALLTLKFAVGKIKAFPVEAN